MGSYIFSAAKFLHLYTMSSFLDRTTTRPGHTTRLSTPGHTTRVRITSRPGHTARLSQNRNHEIPQTPRPESRSYDQNPGARRLHNFTRHHSMPLRRWGALLLVALTFLADSTGAMEAYLYDSFGAVDADSAETTSLKLLRQPPSWFDADMNQLPEGWLM